MEDDTAWQRIQTKTFTKWINTKITTPKNKENKEENKEENNNDLQISDIFIDLRDGTILARLLFVLSGDTIKSTTPALTRFQKVENLHNVLAYIGSRNIKLINIGAVDIVDGNEKLTLGLVWTIILRFSILNFGSVSKDDAECVRNLGDARKRLLAWCRAVTANYGCVDVKDFSRSWQDGMAFNAVIHRFRPDLVDFDKLVENSKNKSKYNDGVNKNMNGLNKNGTGINDDDIHNRNTNKDFNNINGAIDGKNGFSMNESSMNGLSINGLSMNGLSMNGLSMDDHNGARPDDINKINTLESAFAIAEESLGIPRLLDAEDIALVGRPDEKSVMTYVSLFYDMFNKNKARDNKKVGDFLYFYNRVRRIEEEYGNEMDGYKRCKEELKDSNDKVRELLNEARRLSDQARELEREAGYRRVKLVGMAGNIGSVNSYYGINRKNDDLEGLIKDEEFVGLAKERKDLELCSECLRVLDDKNDIKNDYKSDDSVINNRVKNNSDDLENVCCVLGSTQKIESQIHDLEKMNSEIEDGKIKQVFEDKIELFTKLMRRRNVKSVLDDALAMFKKIDTNNKGVISSDERREILGVLGLTYYNNNNEVNGLVDLSVEKTVGLADFMKIVSSLYDSSFDVMKIKSEFMLMSNNGLLDAKEMNLRHEDIEHVVIGENGEEKIDVVKLFERFDINE